MADNKILKKLLERLFASLINGPSLNCRPHSSRQRIDLTQLAKLGDASPEQILRELLGPDARTKVSAKIEAPVKRGSSARRFGAAAAASDDEADDEKLSPEERAAQQAYADQQSVFGKLRSIAEDARTYENDTGVHVLQIGFPLLSLPPGSAGRFGLSRRIMAPLAFISLSMTVKGGPTPSVVLECRNEGADLVVPNLALLSWLEQQTGQKIGELESDAEGSKPWAEICSIAKRVCELVQVELPAAFAGETMPEDFSLVASPRSDDTPRGARGKQAMPTVDAPTATSPLPTAPIENDAANVDAATPSPGTPGEGGDEGEAKDEGGRMKDEKDSSSFIRQPSSFSLPPQNPHPTLSRGIGRGTEDIDSPKTRVIPAAVVGLYPMANQGLLRDMQALAEGEATVGPIESFLKVGVSLESAPAAAVEGEAPVEKRTRTFAEERLVTVADPCQARAVRLARTSRGLVVHGPPGTGKSQTIANVIGDHLARGERVLFVCEKRTALDVVMNRLEGMGLSSLCGIVHDPQRDQRELYKSIREQVDNLADLKSDASAEGKLTKVDAELQKLHNELTDYHAALMKRPDKDSLSFHELMGRWLELSGRELIAAPSRETSNEVADAPDESDTDDAATEVADASAPSGIDPSKPESATPVASTSMDSAAEPAPRVEFDSKLLEGAAHGAVDEHAHALSDLFDRAAKVGYVSNPWTTAAGQTLDEFLTTPADQLRAQAAALRAACESADAIVDPATPPIPAGANLTALALARVRAAGDLERVRDTVSAELRSTWASADVKKIAASAHKLAEAAPHAAKIEGTPLDSELLAIVRDALPSIGQIAEQTAALDAYAESTRSFLGFLAFGKKSAAAKVLAKFGMQPAADKATRVANFLTALKARLLLKDVLAQVAPGAVSGALADDESLQTVLREHQTLLGFLASANADANVADVRELIAAAVAQTDAPADFTRGLRATTARVEAIGQLESKLKPKLFNDAARKTFLADAYAGRPLTPGATALVQRFDSLENVLRVAEGLTTLPSELQHAAAELVTHNVAGEAGLTTLRKASDANEILRRLKANRLLMTADNQQLQSSFTRYQQLDTTKKQLTRAAILHRWASKQRDRLLAATGSRLNGLGADLRRRLTIRGERAMRLRQVIQVGQSIEGGDPLYDLRPVWMASPETVAQLFPRQALFDVVIFDEASQCRLEEALPVLLRAKRVVIAGDPKQLPPTRFFESAVAVSDEQEIETDQQLFETQQGEIEDLLAAALNIEIEECYLDVHYRSRNSDLIEFSNDKFYHSRLQAIPGHPKNRARFAPLSLYAVNGTYDKRANAAEAEKVCQIVRDLLKRASPPSIGIACFNVTQRDLILEKLEDLAEDEPEFGRSLAAARERRSSSSFEGLFVKNLENVQGDERDHIIISTTYGPDPKGKFYRRFGPIGTAGGGRRLNVLVTRARDEVHLVTSIPSTVYRNLPAVPPGETPGGAWLLFAYLVYAEQLAAEYEQNAKLLDQVQATHEPVVTVRPNRFPSNFSKQFAGRLFGQQNLGSDVHWGNDGFCVDIALHHPEQADAVTIGVLCDMNRFEQAADPVEWEVFRTSVLEAQGWTFNRLWTPHFFRDRTGVTASVVNEADAAAAKTDDPDAIRTVTK